MSASERQVLRFAGFELEPDERRLSRRGQAIALTPKVFDLLLLLVRNAGRVLSKDDLMAGLWPGRFVAESNLTKHVWLLRKALDDGGADCVETVSKVGYRFVAPVSEAMAPTRASVQSARPAAPRPKPHLVWAAGAAVLASVVIGAAGALLLRPAGDGPAASSETTVSLFAFNNLSRNPRDAWVAPAMAETLGTEIALSGRLRILPAELAGPAQAAMPAPGPGGYGPDSLRNLRARIGADYVLSGGYLVLGDNADEQVRLDLALQSTRDGHVVSLSRSGPVSTLPAMVSLLGADLRQALGAPPGQTADVQLAVNMQPPSAEVMRRIGSGLDALQRNDPAQARDELLEAVAQAPAYAPAYADLAQAWAALGCQAKARAAIEQAAAYDAGLPTPIRLQIEAERHAAQFDWAGAAADLRQLIVARPADPEPRLQLVSVLLSAGKPKDAAAALDALAALRVRGVDDPRLELAAADVAAARDDEPDRAAHARRALSQARAAGETGLAADAEVQLGVALTGRDARAAGVELRQALADFEQVGNPHGQAWAERNLGNLLSDSDPAAARAAYEQSLALYQGIGDLGGAAGAYSDLGIMLWRAGDRDAARTAVGHVLDLRRQTEDPVGEAWALAALAVEESDDGASDAVVSQLRQAIALDTATGSEAHRGFSLYSLSDELRLRGDLRQARLLCAQAQAAYASVNDLGSRSQADFECAEIALDSGDVATADAEAKAADAVAGARGDAMTVGNAELLHGQIVLGEGNPAEAATAFSRAEATYRGADMVTGEAVAASLLALSEVGLNRARASTDAARASALRDRVTERQEVFAADIALAQLRGQTGDRDQAAAALEALAADAQKRQWFGWALEARLAAVEVLGGERRAGTLRADVAESARRSGFGWVLRRLPT